MFVSHRGHNGKNCGNLTLPCHSVRYAVKISSDNDVIHIDFADGKPYKECENISPNENHTIMLDKSLVFYGFNGRAVLHCIQTYSFFEISSPLHTTSKVVFFGLSIASRGAVIYGLDGDFELKFNFCDIHTSFYFINADTMSCSIQILNSNILSYKDLIWAHCVNLTVRLDGSWFYSCPIRLWSGGIRTYPKPETNIHIHNCTFNMTRRPGSLPCNALVAITLGNLVCNVTIMSSKFVNFYDLTNEASGLTIFSFLERNRTTIVLDGLHFENIHCSTAVIFIDLVKNKNAKLFNVGLLNSMFVNTTKALQMNIDGSRLIPIPTDFITFRNNTFISTRGAFGRHGLIYLYGGFYRLSSCHFFHNVPVKDIAYPLFLIDNSVMVTFENCSYESYPIAEINRNNSNMFYIISYQSMKHSVNIKGNLTISCPQGYTMIMKTDCYKDRNSTVCSLFLVACEQCRVNTYSLLRGESHNNKSNHITCQECPVGSSCSEGQITSKKNFWGYKSKRRITFLQCPPKYCCDNINHCEHYNSCYGNRNGVLCGECASGMSESLFDTECKPNKDCKSVIFWVGVGVYLILYLLFFLYQEDAFRLVQTRFFSRIIFSSRNGQKAKLGSLLKIVFYYYQVVRLFRNSVESEGKVPILDKIDNFFSRAVNFLTISFPSFECPIQDLRPVNKAIIVHSEGLTLLVLLCVLYFSTILYKMFQKIRNRFALRAIAADTETIDPTLNLVHNSFLDRISGAFTYISLLMYASSTSLCLSLLHCVPIDNSLVLFLDGNIKCFQTFQKIVFAYMIFSIVPFCLVPVFGSYLLMLNRISVPQFCLACVIPFPFCCYWSYLLVRNSSRENGPPNIATGTQQGIIDESSRDTDTSRGNESLEENLNSETVTRCRNSAVLRVLLGPFRLHKATFVFPASNLPWEGFLIFRRLVLILTLTFVPDNSMKATLSTMLCVAILLVHVFVRPFKDTRDNVLETLSLGTLIIISLCSLVKSIYNGEDLDSGNLLKMVNTVEYILIISPLALILFLVILCIIFKVVAILRFCFLTLSRRMNWCS